jgi:molybdate transport system regulatory protein
MSQSPSVKASLYSGGYIVTESATQGKDRPETARVMISNGGTGPMKIHQVRIRIHFSPSGSLGPGKIELLEEIQRTGSLSKAAREMGMGYRTAWLLLKSLNGLLDEPVAMATRGGAGGGGGVKLTSTGKDLVSAYRLVERALSRQAQRNFGRFTAASDRSGSIPTPVQRLPQTRGGRKKTA